MCVFSFIQPPHRFLFVVLLFFFLVSLPAFDSLPSPTSAALTLPFSLRSFKDALLCLRLAAPPLSLTQLSLSIPPCSKKAPFSLHRTPFSSFSFLKHTHARAHTHTHTHILSFLPRCTTGRLSFSRFSPSPSLSLAPPSPPSPSLLSPFPAALPRGASPSAAPLPLFALCIIDMASRPMAKRIGRELEALVCPVVCLSLPPPSAGSPVPTAMKESHTNEKEREGKRLSELQGQRTRKRGWMQCFGAHQQTSLLVLGVLRPPASPSSQDNEPNSPPSTVHHLL